MPTALTGRLLSARPLRMTTPTVLGDHRFMATKQSIVLVSMLLAAGVIAACGTSSEPTASRHVVSTVSSPTDSPTASDSGSPSAPVSSPAAPVSDALACGSVLDPTGYKNGPLTTNVVVAFLTDMGLTDGVANIPSGTPSSADTNILDTMAMELANYSGNQLSADAEQFSQDERSYNPDGPVDTSYAQPLLQDVLALERDCPQGTTMGEQWRNKGGS